MKTFSTTQTNLYDNEKRFLRQQKRFYDHKKWFNGNEEVCETTKIQARSGHIIPVFRNDLKRSKVRC